MAAPRGLPNGDAAKEYQTFRDFQGMNRQAIRTSIARNEFAYLQNLMPVGSANLQTVRSAALNCTITQATKAVVGWSVNLLGMLTLSGVSGTFTVGATVTGSITGSTGTVLAFSGNTLELGNVTASFVASETASGSGGGSGVVVSQAMMDWALSNFSDGSLWAENMSSPHPTFVQIAAPGTNISDVTPWSDSVALLVGPNGYYFWNGSGTITKIVSNDSITLLVTPTQVLNLTTVVGAFDEGETVTGGTSTATGIVAFWDPGPGNLYVDTVVGTFDPTETITGSTSSATGVVNTVTNIPNFLVGESITQVGGSQHGVVVSWDPTTGTLVLDSVAGGNFVTDVPIHGTSSGASAIVNFVDASAPPTSGNYIAVYQGRVWVAIGRTVNFSGPNDYTATSWDVGLGAGSFTILDSTLKGNITRLVVANGYLYIFGPTSIDIISNVYVPQSAVPPLPLFTRTNINAVVGSPYPQSVVVYDRLIMFYNKFGIWALSGVQVERVSEKIDQIIQQLNPNPPGLVSGGVGMCNNLLTTTFLVSWFDPDVSTLTSRQVILSFFDGKWFLYDPFNVNPTGTMACLFAATVANVPSSVLLYDSANGGNFDSKVHLLFQSEDVPIVRRMQTALWDFGLSIMIKQALRFGIEGDVVNLEFSIMAQVDSENVSTTPDTFLPKTFTWLTPQNKTFLWTTLSGSPFTWVVGGYAYNYADAQMYGRYLGITASGITGDAVLSGFNLEYERRTRATWELQQ